MSNLVLNVYASKRADELLEEVIAEYNNPDLTLKGKREVLHTKLFLAILEGFNLRQEVEDE